MTKFHISLKNAANILAENGQILISVIDIMFDDDTANRICDIMIDPDLLYVKL
jgi:hypothetical protein